MAVSGTVGVVAVIIVTYLYNSTTAQIADYAQVTCTGAVTVSA